MIRRLLFIACALMVGSCILVLAFSFARSGKRAATAYEELASSSSAPRSCTIGDHELKPVTVDRVSGTQVLRVMSNPNEKLPSNLEWAMYDLGPGPDGKGRGLHAEYRLSDGGGVTAVVTRALFSAADCSSLPTK